jgi:hypothetical protein
MLDIFVAMSTHSFILSELSSCYIWGEGIVYKNKYDIGQNVFAAMFGLSVVGGGSGRSS